MVKIKIRVYEARDQLHPGGLNFKSNSYAEMFGEVPPLPKAKFEFSSEIDPKALILTEKLRAQAFYNDVFDMKTTQLTLFAMLLVKGSGAAKFHALAARQSGATWQELHQVMELVNSSIGIRTS